MIHSSKWQKHLKWQVVRDCQKGVPALGNTRHTRRCISGLITPIHQHTSQAPSRQKSLSPSLGIVSVCMGVHGGCRCVSVCVCVHVDSSHLEFGGPGITAIQLRKGAVPPPAEKSNPNGTSGRANLRPASEAEESGAKNGWTQWHEFPGIRYTYTKALRYKGVTENLHKGVTVLQFLGPGRKSNEQEAENCLRPSL